MLTSPRFLHELHGLRFWRTPDFFPPRPDRKQLETLETIVIGTKNRTLGDALILSSLPARLTKAYPQLHIRAFVRGHSPWVFLNNPAIDGLSRAPRTLYGDDCNWGEGHLIQQKERWFHLEPSITVKPEIFLSDTELRTARAEFETQGPSAKPIVVLHAAGGTHQGGGLSHEQWNRLCTVLQPYVRIWQLAQRNDQVKIPAAERAWIFEAGGLELRRMFAGVSQVQGFIGVDSGPMHVARAFEIPSLILSRRNDVTADLARADREPYFLHGNLPVGFLYRENTHIESHRFDGEEGYERALQWVATLKRNHD